ncbi:hypothetical protein LMH87_005404 [Akanthomyces muscarius]|uniref:Uncharacterized protein n=1 Tax=Akanthomyces muscarius TaxID=2231603 RepID=A0A9W8QLQ5_AKAMU|nr:hypothetical protein LMH87_005404 [Akanthomyces muscarius]KAJ4163693.1 hypothetical protein LMH87_005404 [Akanthomyces muscarius]
MPSQSPALSERSGYSSSGASSASASAYSGSRVGSGSPPQVANGHFPSGGNNPSPGYRTASYSSRGR